MKKYLFMAIAAAAMTGCSQDESLDVAQKEAIGFGEAFVENSTRAIDESFSADNKPATFLVYGTTKGDGTNESLVSIFNGIEVSKNTTTGVGDDYKYAANYTQYWIKDNKYNFAALVNATDDNVTDGTDLLPSTVKFTTTDDNTDLLYAKSAEITGKASGSNSTVEFTFDHLLSKVLFTVKNTITSNTAEAYYQYQVENVKITNAYKTATCTVADKTWASHEGSTAAVDFGNVSNATSTSTENTAIAIGKQEAKADEATSHYARLLIPGKYTGNTDELAKLNITCTIKTLYNGNVVDTEAYNKDVAVTLEAGKAYNFVISKGNPGDPIKFSVSTVNKWDDTHNNYTQNL